jgi:hypothetical protein
MKNVTKRRLARKVRFEAATDKSEAFLTLLRSDILPILKKPREWLSMPLPLVSGATWIGLVSTNPRLIRNWTRRFVR